MKLTQQIILAGAAALFAAPALAAPSWMPGDKVWGKPADAPWSDCMIATTRGDARGVIYDASCRVAVNGTFVTRNYVFRPAQVRPFSETPPS